MPKASKSSASAGTRKKHAKKAGKEGPDPASTQQPMKQRGEKKLSKAQRKALPKVKQYIPPPKPPAPPIPDPLDGQGLAKTLPAELVVVLRRLGKKDEVTRRKGLEELREGWVQRLEEGDEVERELRENTLLSAVPVWFHNLASLLQSPFHRSLALQLHAELLSIPSVRSAIVDTLSLGLLPGTQNRDVLGSWMVAALEEGRRGGGSGLRSWDEVITWSPPGQDSSEEYVEHGRIDLAPQLSSLLEYLSLSVLDPPSLHDDIFPAPVTSTPSLSRPLPKGGKGGKGQPATGSSTPQPAPTPADDQSVLEERWARYRVGGLTGLVWLVQQLSKHKRTTLPPKLSDLVRTTPLWSALSSISSEDSPVIGYQQPPVRKAAYALLDSLVDAFPDEIAQQGLLELLSTSVLDVCWMEKEGAVWQQAGPAVVKFLSKYRQCWEIASRTAAERVSAANGQAESAVEDAEDEENDDEDEGEEEEEEEEEEEHVDPVEVPATTATNSGPAMTTTSKAFNDFLEFITTTCPSIPHLTYPLLIVVISTLPDSLLSLEPDPSPALKNLFAHLWSPVDARLLTTHALPGQLSAFQTFFQDAVDCTVFLASKAIRREQGGPAAEWLVKEQLGNRVWVDGVLAMGGRAGRRRGTQDQGGVEAEAAVFGKGLTRLAAISEDLVRDLMPVLTDAIVEQCFPADFEDARKTVLLLPRTLPIISAIREGCSHASVTAALDGLIGGISQRCAEKLSAIMETPSAEYAIYAGMLVEALRRHPALIGAQTRADLSASLQSKATALLSVLSPALFISLYDSVSFASTDDSSGGASTDRALWALIEDPQIPQETRFALALDVTGLPSTNLVYEGSLDAIALEATQAALSGDLPIASSVAAACVRRSELSSDALHTVLALVCTAIHDSIHFIISDRPDTSIPIAALDVFAAYAASNPSELVASDILMQALVAVRHAATLLPRLESPISVPAIANEIWASVIKLSQEEQVIVARQVTASLADLIGEVSCRLSPDALVDVALITPIGNLIPLKPADLFSTLLPTSIDLLRDIAHHASQPPDGSLPITDPLIPCTSEERFSLPPSDFDAQGLSKAARHAEAALALLRADRHLAEALPALLQFVLQASILAEDAIALPGASRGFFSPLTSSALLANFTRDAEGTLSYAMASLDDLPLSWHTATVQQLKTTTTPPRSDFVRQILWDLAQNVVLKGGDVSARVFRDVLGRLLRQSGAGEKEGEIWLGYGMSLAEKAPQLALAVILAIKPILLDSKPFETAQNRLASALTTVPAKSANAKGIPALRLLVASAPPADAASVFLPQQRAVFVLRHVAGWLTSDDAEDLDEEVELRLAQLYVAVAPIVQDLSGAHWDAIFDLVESSLESSTLAETASYPLMYQSLVLLQQIRDLCTTNKSLRAIWTGKDTQIALVLKLFLQCRDVDSIPLQMIQALLLDLLQDVPDSAVEATGIADLADLLLLSSSAAIQCTAYRILSRVIRSRTLALVLDVEASVSKAEEGQASRTIALPEELVGIVRSGLAFDWYSEEAVSMVLGQLLAWMAILDHFDDASRTLRWAYLDQLNSSQLLTQSLLPLLFAVLGVSEVGAWNFPASSYAVDEFYPDLLDPEDLPDLAPLASHLFYRALVTLPSAMRTYYEGLKDRQLSMSMLAFTARHYSPVIIGHEFSALREPRAMAQLTEEGLNVRIAQGGGATVAAAAGAGSAEAIASYVVDEQPMEIGIRLPAEFPLKGVDVRDLRRVGVPENKWRGWLMSVQQTVTSRNGLMLEALTVFKKNVALHFEGVVECAICYSIISLTDRTLPTKPCRTCKNRFHASCLFKWFNSSHSSSCPLCRSLF